jgi:hypothetical protein
MTGERLVDYARTMEQAWLTEFPQFAEFILSFSETPLSYPPTITMFGGRLVSSPLYNHILHTLRCVQLRRARSVVEIGGGYGAPGRIWMTNGLHTPNLYVDIDLPESLFYAEVYMKSTLPDVPVTYLHDDTTIPGDGIILCPTHNAERLLSIDIELIYNTGSLQEMSTEYVDFYANLINVAKCDLFYSSNYFGQSVTHFLESMNFAAPVMPPEWVSTFKNLFPDPARSVAEFAFSRTFGPIDEREVSTRLRAMFAAEYPRNLREFQDIFDLARRITDPELIMEVVANTMRCLQDFPKELIFLARRAKLAGRLSSAEEALASILERAAMAAVSSMGQVDGTIINIRNRLINQEQMDDLPDGRLVESVHGTVAKIEGIEKRLRSEYCGSIEYVKDDPPFISGWALARDRAEIALIVHAFYERGLVASVRPSLARPEFALGDAPIGFCLDLPNGLDLKEVQVLAEFSDGTLGRLTNGSQ